MKVAEGIPEVAGVEAWSLGPLELWHLLSLDAPTVAVVWTWFAARSAQVRLPPVVPFAMFLAVWLLYAGDRLLDTRFGVAGQWEERHRFHFQHRRLFRAAIAAAAAVLAYAAMELPKPMLQLYLGLGAALALWFAALHFLPRRLAESLPKEVVPGLFFALAVFLPVATSAPRMLSAGLLFGTLCALNCLCIYAWEHTPGTLDQAHPVTRYGVRRLRPLALLLIVSVLALVPFSPAGEAGVLRAVAASSALLLLLDHFADRLSGTTLRAAADLVLLTPLLAAPFLR